MADIIVPQTTRDLLKKLIGNEFTYFECTSFLFDTLTYGCLLLETDEHRLEISNMQEAVAGFDAYGDFPVLRCRELNNNEVFRPFRDTPVKKYPLQGTITGIDIVNDTIVAPTLEAPLERTQGIIAYTDKNIVTVSVDVMFSECLSIIVSPPDAECALPQVESIRKSWQENPEDDVRVTRTVIRLR